MAMATPRCPDDSGKDKQPSHDAATAADKANDEAPAAAGKGKTMTTLPQADETEEDVLWVWSKDGHINPTEYETTRRTGGRRVAVLPPSAPTTRLPAEEVDMILSMEAYRFVPDDVETVRRLFPRETDETMEIMREAVEASEEAREGFLEYQDWVRAEKEEKGYVEVPNKFIEDRAEIIDWMQEEMDKMIKSLNIPDRYFASGGSDDKRVLARRGTALESNQTCHDSKL